MTPSHSRRQVVSGESDRLIKRKRTCSSTLLCVGEDMRARSHQTWNIANKAYQTPRRASTPNSSISNSSSILVSPRAAAGDHRTAVLVHDIDQECIPETHPHRMHWTDKQHNNDEPRIQHTQEVCDCAARFRPGCWFSSVQDQKRLGCTTSGSPTNRTEIGTDKYYRFFK